MALNIAGATIQATTSTGLSITTNSVTGLSIDSSDRPILSARPGFMVEYSSSASWYNYTSAGYQIILYSNILYNNGSCYNNSNGRFTAPVSGIYWFTSMHYSYKNTDTSSSSYTHPHFIVNGSYNTKHAQLDAPFRYVRGRTYYSSTYSFDTEMNDLFYLTAGDYVNVEIYAGSALQYYGPQSYFTGCLIT